MSNLQVYPYVATEHGWSISDSVMAAIYLQLEQEDKIRHLFYDGSLTDVSAWLQYVKLPGTFLIIVADIDRKIPVHIVWLKDASDGVAWAHHCALGKYCRGVWEKVIEYWKSMPINIVLGLTPESNVKAVKFLTKICKFTVVGRVPYVCNMVYENRRVGGIFSYFPVNEAAME
jgi:hypothetical protein